MHTIVPNGRMHQTEKSPLVPWACPWTGTLSAGGGWTFRYWSFLTAFVCPVDLKLQMCECQLRMLITLCTFSAFSPLFACVSCIFLHLNVLLLTLSEAQHLLIHSRRPNGCCCLGIASLLTNGEWRHYLSVLLLFLIEFCPAVVFRLLRDSQSEESKLMSLRALCGCARVSLWGCGVLVCV